MAKFDPGTKQTCPECGAKFYDLNKRPAICPKCAHSFNPDAGQKLVKKRELPPESDTAKGDDDDGSDEDGDAKPAEEADIEGLDAEEEEAESLSLDSDEPSIMTIVDDDEDSDPSESGKALPEGFTEEGVEDDSSLLVDDDDEEIDLEDDLDDEPKTD